MLNDVRPPPIEPREPHAAHPETSSGPTTPHVEAEPPHNHGGEHPAIQHVEAYAHRSDNGHAGRHLSPHENLKEPGRHHSRYLGEIPTTTDPMYAMPFEERGSGFNIAMSVVALLLFGVLIVSAWWTLG